MLIANPVDLALGVPALENLLGRLARTVHRPREDRRSAQTTTAMSAAPTTHQMPIQPMCPFPFHQCMAHLAPSLCGGGVMPCGIEPIPGPMPVPEACIIPG